MYLWKDEFPHARKRGKGFLSHVGCVVVAVLIVCLLAGMPGFVIADAVAQGDTCGVYGALRYEILEDQRILIEDCTADVTAVEIPEEIDGLPVTDIGKYAFSDCENLSSISLPTTVVNIGMRAFQNTSWLKVQQAANPLVILNDILIDGTTCTGSVTVPDGVTHIAGGAFAYCEEITALFLPNTVTEIANAAFYDCTNLAEISMPESVTVIGYNVFTHTPWLAERQAENPFVIVNDILIDGTTCSGAIVIPDTVTQICEGAFAHNENPLEVTVPGSVTRIAGGAFSVCIGLTAVTLEEGVQEIGSAFYQCENLTEISLPESLTKIGDYVFLDCPTLEEITLPQGVTQIGDGAFSGCVGLRQITIPDSVVTMGTGVFQDCDSLTDVYFGGTAVQWDTIYVPHYTGLYKSPTGEVEGGREVLYGVLLHFSDGQRLVEDKLGKYPQGDLDGNDVIDANDAYLCLYAYAQQSVSGDSGLTAAQLAAADVDGDGAVTADDAYYMLLLYARNSVGEYVTFADILS